jgi:hypothetical protein
MTWFYRGKEIDEEFADGWVGFVYLITNKLNGRKYIGKKLFSFTRRKAVKGSKRKKKVLIPSDWNVYYGSNKELNEDVKIHGPDNFKREIIRLCSTKSECNYYEAKEQFLTDAIIRDDYYNQYIQVRVHKNNSLK